MKGTVYGLYIDTPIGERWYIGQTYRNVYTRWDEHRKNRYNCDRTSIHDAIDEHGWFAFKKVVLETIRSDSLDDLLTRLLIREREWITEKCAYGKGFNESEGILTDEGIQSYISRIKKTKKEPTRISRSKTDYRKLFRIITNGSVT